MFGKKYFLLYLLLSTLLITEFLFLSKSRSCVAQPLAIIIPHHNLIETKRREFIGYISQKGKPPKTIVLISPNHFSANQGVIFFSDKNWKLSNGMLPFDTDIPEDVTNLTVKENGVVANDHGIYNILPEIKRYYPDSKILPILIGSQTPLENINSLAKELQIYCNDDCLLVGSVDFSHYLPAGLAYIHDIYSHKILENNKVDKILNLEIDNPKTLYLISKVIGKSEFLKFNTCYSSNSGFVENNFDAETTGYLMGWYEKVDNPPTLNNIFTFVLANNVQKEPNVKGLGERFFYGADYTNANLEEKIVLKNVVIEPQNGQPSQIQMSDDIIIIRLGYDMAVGGIVDNNNERLFFFPIEKIDNEDRFVMGLRKNEFYKALFSELYDTDSIFINSENGTITLSK